MLDIKINKESADKKQEAASYRTKLTEKYSLADALASIKEMVGKPVLGTQLHFWTLGRWSTHQLLVYLLKYTGPTHLLFSTYTISENALRILHDHKEAGHIKSICALVDKRFTIRSPKARQFAEKVFNKYVLFDCHAKVTILDNEVLPLVIIGSANWSENKRYECGVICYDAKVVRFWKTKINEAMNDAKAKC